jgi:Ca2+/Na+ antiporter
VEEFKKFGDLVGILVNAGLITINLIILQVWISSGPPDPSSFISLIAIAVSTPMLSFDLLTRQIPDLRVPNKMTIFLLRMNAILSVIIAAIGVVAAMWHVSWIAGIIIMLIGFYCYLLYNFVWNYTEKSLKKEQKKFADQNSQ